MRGGCACLNKPVFMWHGGEETALLLFRREVLASAVSVLPGHIHHFQMFYSYRGSCVTFFTMQIHNPKACCINTDWNDGAILKVFLRDLKRIFNLL